MCVDAERARLLGRLGPGCDEGQEEEEEEEEEGSLHRELAVLTGQLHRPSGRGDRAR